MTNLQQKEFSKMSNEELCAIAARLKFQLVEARFKMSSGELAKVSVVSQIRKTIAKIFTELTNRGVKVSIGSHGITMYDLKNGNKPTSINQDKVQELIQLQEKKEKKSAEAKQETTKATEVKEVKPEAKEVKAEAKEVKPEAKEVKVEQAAEEKKGENK